MNQKDYAIGILSTTAAILLVGLLIIGTRPEAVAASGMTATGRQYVLTVGTDISADEELLYVIDAPQQKLIVYRFDSARQRIEIAQGIDLQQLRQANAPAGQQRGQKSRSRRRGP